MNKRVSLVNLYLPEQKSLYPPLGIMYIAAALKSIGIQAFVFHVEATERNMRNVLEESREALFVGISALTGRTLRHNLQLSQLLKKSRIPVLWGGIHATFLPENTLSQDCIDYIIMGEGEESICEFANKLIAKDSLAGIKGLGYKNNGKFILNGTAALLDDLDKYSLDWNTIKVERYLYDVAGIGKFLPYLTSRGCPHRCGFCYNINFNKRTWRKREQSKVIEEIVSLKQKYRFNGIDFIDDNFFTNQERAFNIARGIKTPWIAEVRADYVTEDFIKRCKDSGCYKLIIGCESGSDDLLKLINKDVTVAQIKNTVQLCYAHGIKVYCSFMIMLPGETNRDRDATFNFINYLMDTYPDIEIDGPKVYTPYPGAPLFEICKKNGWQEPKSTEDWSCYHRSMNPSLLGYVSSRDIKRNMILAGSIAVKHGLLTKISAIKRGGRFFGARLLIPFLWFYKCMISARLRYKFVYLPIDIKAYIFGISTMNKFLFKKSTHNQGQPC